MASTGIAQRELAITRILDAPRDRVFRAWTDPEQVKCWFGPKGFTIPFAEIDLRVGGKYRNVMRSPDGKDYWSAGTYREIVEPERIVITDSFSDAEGNVVPASYYGMSGDWPLELLVTITFEEYDGKTKLTLRHEGMPEGENADGAEQGWNESFDKLAEYLASGCRRTTIVAEPGKQELFITREFDALRELVFRAFVEPDLYVQWLGPREIEMRLETFEPRTGGSYRYIHKDKDGNEYGFHGVYHEIKPPERIIDTWEFEGLPESGHVSLETARFEALPGDKTGFTAQAVFLSVADRDGLIQSDMERGVVESYERLDELLERLKKER